MAGIFMSKKDDRKPYNKPVLNEREQLDLLLSRKMIISDQQRALHYLQFIGYYRLSGYAIFFVIQLWHTTPNQFLRKADPCSSLER